MQGYIQGTVHQYLFLFFIFTQSTAAEQSVGKPALQWLSEELQLCAGICNSQE